ncbi:MAG: glycosyltransferase [Aquaticitalea sp.]
MKKILYIAYQFPPLNIGGSARPAKFVKYLNRYGISPTIVTLHPESYKRIYANAKSDSNLLSDGNLQEEILQIHSKDSSKRRQNRILNFIDIFFNPYRGNEKKYWKDQYNESVNTYLKHNTVSAIVVTAPPFGILSLAVATSKKHNIPLIVDMRDPWTLWTIAPYGTYFNFLATKSLERKVFKQASKIIATSKVTIEDFKKLHPSINEDKFEYIPNGFDHDIEFHDIVYTPKMDITIGYVGSFYFSPQKREEIMEPWWKKKGHRKLQYVPRKEDWLYRTPYFFFKSLQKLFQLNPEFKERITVKFAGNKDIWFDAMVKEFDLQANVEHLGWMSHEDSIKFQKSCDFLLITSSKVIDGKDYSIAGKTFEYFTIQKPILAYVADGAQKDILQQSNLAHSLSIDDANVAAEKLKEVFSTSQTLSPNKVFINSFKVNVLTKQFANTIKSALK